jgi:hypothetical protein
LEHKIAYNNIHVNEIELEVITKTEKKLKATTETEHYMIIYGGVYRNMRAHAKSMNQ